MKTASPLDGPIERLCELEALCSEKINQSKDRGDYENAAFMERTRNILWLQRSKCERTRLESMMRLSVEQPRKRTLIELASAFHDGIVRAMNEADHA